MDMQIKTRVEAVDAPLDRRPGVPAQREPEKVGNAHWTVPEKQPARLDVTKDRTRDALTATFGTGQPPRGVSGMIRRAAYQIPDYQAKRWAMLLFADRVDVVEARVVRAAKNPVTWVAAAGVLLLLARPKRVRRGLFGFLRR